MGIAIRTAETLVRTDLPAVHRTADENSGRAQRSFLRATRLRLAMLVAAGAAGGFSWIVPDTTTDVAGIVAATAFIVAVAVEAYLLQVKPERRWYDSRAAAETAKTLAWRFAVGGAPFRVDACSQREAESLFLKRLRDIPVDIEDVDLTPSLDDGVQISERMREVRTATLDDRKRAYQSGRVIDQQRWYATNARRHASRARTFGMTLLLVEVVGVIGGLLRATGVIATVDPFQLAGALAAAIAAWAQARQHESLARAYSVAALELSSIRSMIDAQATEDDWSRFVEDAEQAISREHTLWRASRGSRRP